MRVNLLLNSPTMRNGFLNIDPFATPGDGKIYGHVTCLDGHVEDAQASEILASDVLDFLPPKAVNDAVTHWIKKLRHGGTITIGGLDLREVARRLSSHQISIDEANLLVYGEQSSPWQCRKAAVSLPLMADQLQRTGLVVTGKSYREVFYSVTARRP